VGPQESVRWTGGTPYRGFVARSPETLHQDSRYCELRNADGVKDVESQTRACVGVSAYRESGVGDTSCSTSRVPKSR
jgi:hypothetical protein